MTTAIPLLDADVCDRLRRVVDPELGVSIVDLGFVLSATRTSGRIDVALTLTGRSCPLGGMILDEVREVLGGAFPHATIEARLVWDAPCRESAQAWSAERAAPGHAPSRQA